MKHQSTIVSNRRGLVPKDFFDCSYRIAQSRKNRCEGTQALFSNIICAIQVFGGRLFLLNTL